MILQNSSLPARQGMELIFLAHSHNWLIISTILLKLVVSTRGEDFGGLPGSLPARKAEHIGRTWLIAHTHIGGDVVDRGA